MEKKEFMFADITEKIIGSAFNVHSAIGSGFPEVVYQRALVLEFNEKKLSFQRELEMPLFYKSVEIGKRRVDFLVEKKVLVELKAVSGLDEGHYNQILNYLTAYQLEIGLLINFGERSLKFKRFIKNRTKVSFN